MPPRVSHPQDFQSLLALYNVTQTEITRYRDREWINTGLFLASMATIIGFMMTNETLARSFALHFGSTLIVLAGAHIHFSKFIHDRLTVQRNVKARIQYLLNFTDIQVGRKPLLPPMVIDDISKSSRDDNFQRGWYRGFWSHLLLFWLATFLLAVFGIWFLWLCN